MNIRSFIILQPGHDHFYKLCVYQEILLIDFNKKKLFAEIKKIGKSCVGLWKINENVSFQNVAGY